MNQQQFDKLSGQEKYEILKHQPLNLEHQLAIRTDAKVGDSENDSGRFYRASFGNVVMSNWSEDPRVAVNTAYENLEAFKTNN